MNKAQFNSVYIQLKKHIHECISFEAFMATELN